MAAKFEIYADRSDHFRFRLKASNGEILAVSESYISKASALNAVESVRSSAATAEIREL